MKILDLTIGKKYPPIVIAEISGNHNQSLTTAIELLKKIPLSLEIKLDPIIIEYLLSI